MSEHLLTSSVISHSCEGEAAGERMCCSHRPPPLGLGRATWFWESVHSFQQLPGPLTAPDTCRVYFVSPTHSQLHITLGSQARPPPPLS